MPSSLTTTRILIGINAAVFLLWNTLRPESAGAGPLGLYLPENEDFRLWQFFTSMFMHGNLGHLLMNMVGLLMFGEVLERMWGARRFLLFYLLTGLGAGLIYTAVTSWEVHAAITQLVEQGFNEEAIRQGLNIPNPNAALMTMIQRTSAVVDATSGQALADVYLMFNSPVVGASGAIYGILTAFGLLFPNAKLALIFLPVPVAAKYFIPGLLLMDLFSGVTGVSIFGGGIAHFAHLGGALIGFCLMLYWKDLAKPLPQYTNGLTS
jgi:membrane associated rhomboid family serine protease